MGEQAGQAAPEGPRRALDGQIHQGQAERGRAPRVDLAVPASGYKNHLGIDRRHRLIRSWRVTDAARHDGALLPELIDPNNTASDVWADTAYRSQANEKFLAGRLLRSQIHRKKPKGKPMPRRTARANARKSAIARRSSTSLPARKVRWACLSAPSGSPARRPRSASLTSSTTCSEWFGSPLRPQQSDPRNPPQRQYRPRTQSRHSADHGQTQNADLLGPKAPIGGFQLLADVDIRCGPGPAGEPVIMTRRERCGCLSIARQQAQEIIEALAIKAKARRKLLQKWPEFFFEAQYPGCKEIGKRCFDIVQLLQRALLC